MGRASRLAKPIHYVLTAITLGLLVLAFLVVVCVHSQELPTLVVSWVPISKPIDIQRLEFSGVCWYRIYVYNPMNLTVCAPFATGVYRCIYLKNFTGEITLAPPAEVYNGSVRLIAFLQPCTPPTAGIAPALFAGYYPYSIALYYSSLDPSVARFSGAVSGYVTRIIRGSGWSTLYVTSVRSGDYETIRLEVLGNSTQIDTVTQRVQYYVSIPRVFQPNNRTVCIYVEYVPIRVSVLLHNGTVLYTDLEPPGCIELPRGTVAYTVYFDNSVYSSTSGFVNYIKQLLSELSEVAKSFRAPVASPWLIYTIPNREFQIYVATPEVYVNGSLLQPGEVLHIAGCRLEMGNRVIRGVCSQPGRFRLYMMYGSRANTVLIDVESPMASILTTLATVAVAIAIASIAIYGIRVFLTYLGSPHMLEKTSVLGVIATDIAWRVAVVLIATSPTLWGAIYWIALDFGDVLSFIDSSIDLIASAIDATLVPVTAMLIVGSGAAIILGYAAWAMTANPWARLALSTAALIGAAISATAAVAYPIGSFMTIYTIPLVISLEMLKMFIKLVLIGIPMYIAIAGALLSISPLRRFGFILIEIGITMSMGTAAGLAITRLVLGASGASLQTLSALQLSTNILASAFVPFMKPIALVAIEPFRTATFTASVILISFLGSYVITYVVSRIVIRKMIGSAAPEILPPI